MTIPQTHGNPQTPGDGGLSRASCSKPALNQYLLPTLVSSATSDLTPVLKRIFAPQTHPTSVVTKVIVSIVMNSKS